MAKVGAELGLTLKLFKDDKTFEFIRPAVEMKEITVKITGTVEEQIGESVIALRKVYKSLSEEMQSILDEQFGQIESELRQSLGGKK